MQTQAKSRSNDLMQCLAPLCCAKLRIRTARAVDETHQAKRGQTIYDYLSGTRHQITLGFRHSEIHCADTLLLVSQRMSQVKILLIFRFGRNLSRTLDENVSRPLEHRKGPVLEPRVPERFAKVQKRDSPRFFSSSSSSTAVSRRDTSSERERGQRHQLHRGALRALPRPAASLTLSFPSSRRRVCISERRNANSHVLLARYAREKGRDTVSVERKDQERTAVLPRGFLTSRGGREGGWLADWLAG